MTGLRSLGAGFREYKEWAKDPRPRVGSGLSWLDGKMNGGLAKSEVMMLMAFSSVGKTAVALNFIRNNPQVPAVVFSLEMSWRMLAARLAAMHTETPTWELEKKIKEMGEHDLIHEIELTRRDFPYLLCDDTPALTLKDMDASLTKAAEIIGQPPRLVVIDFLELIGGAGILSKSESVDRASQKVRDLVRKHDASGILLHQVGKGDSDNPGAEALDLASGRYGGHQPMDYVVGAWAPRLKRNIRSEEAVEVQDDLFLQLLKNRAGQAAPGSHLMQMDHRTLRLEEKPQAYWAPSMPVPAA